MSASAAEPTPAAWWRDLLLWCAPALAVGLALRIALTVQAPWAIYHGDTSDLLDTAHHFFQSGELVIHKKKTFLAPLFVAAHLALPFPAMKTIAITQHALGVAMIVLAGLLCRWWFPHWKWALPPVTGVMAAHPALLWYEHTVMAESLYVFCVMLLAVAATALALRATWTRFLLLCGALVLVAGARPEGKLLFAFALLLLALLLWGQWRTLGLRVAVLLAVALGTHRITRTEQGGLLLYTSVAWLTPSALHCAPGFEEYFAPIRAALESSRREGDLFPSARQRSALGDAVKAYLAAQPRGSALARRKPEDLCQRMAVEVILRHWTAMPGWIVTKFAHSAAEPSSGAFDAEWLHRRQAEAIQGEGPAFDHLAPRLYGFAVTEAQAPELVRRTHAPLAWFDTLQRRWTATVNAWRVGPLAIPGYFLLAAAGLLVAPWATPRLRRFHLAWSLALAGLCVVVMLTANVRSRFRFVFEPFVYLYLAMLGQVLAVGIGEMRRHFRARPAANNSVTVGKHVR